MRALERVVPTPRLVESDALDLAVPLSEAWEIVRHADFSDLPLMPFRVDDLRSTREQPGYAVLVDDAPRELVVGGIGKGWRLARPAVHAPDARAFTAFAEPGFVKLACGIQLSPLGDAATHVRFELRVDATDSASWTRFRRYFAIVGPPLRLLRKSILARLAKKHGTPADTEDQRALPGDELIGDAETQITRGIDIHASPEEIWPWLVQMGVGRGGFYRVDTIDNVGARSAREIHPELQDLRVGDVIPADDEHGDGYEVLEIDPDRALVLGALHDVEARHQLPFAAIRPARFWHATWSFVLEPLEKPGASTGGDTVKTRVHVRARAAFPKSGRAPATWIRPVRALLETTQLRHLAARVEGRMPSDDWRDVAEGIGGLGVMMAAFLTPFRRQRRSHWGLDEETASLRYPGDELVTEPRWSWTHAVEIDAPASDVWPWVAQLGADRGGFYSYQWLENITGADIHNAEAVHDELALRVGAPLVLHPQMPPLQVVEVAPGRRIIAHAPPDPRALEERLPWIDASWAFYILPLGEARCGVVSRYRVMTSDDLKTRLTYGPTLLEPIGFAMDRRMLLGIKERAEGARRRTPLRSFARRGGNKSREPERRSP